MPVRARIRESVRGNRRLWAYVCVFALASLLYLPTLRFGFLGYDDTLLIVDNHPFLSRLSNAPRAFAQDAFEVPGYDSSNSYYRPVMTLSLMVDAHLGGTAPLLYHLDNVLEHALASCLVLALLLSLGYPLLASFLLSLFFALHPLWTGVVAWVPGRVDSLMAFFALNAAIAFVSFLRRGGSLRYAWHILAFALAAFTKEVGIFLPVPILFAFLAVREGRRDSKRLWKLIPAWAAVLLGWYLMRRMAVSSPQPIGELLANAWRNLIILIHYVGKAILPVNLSVAPTPADTSIYPGIAVVVLLTSALVFSRSRRARFIALGIVWFLAFTGPSLVVPRFVGFEQRLYLPMVGILILLLETDLRGLLARARIGPAVAICLLVLIAGLAVHRTSIYRSRLSFWESAVSTSPHSSYARASLGAVYMSRGRTQDARLQYVRALELNPVEPKANGNLGVIAAREGHRDEARQYFLKEISANPGYADAYFNLGQSYAEAGDLQNAVKMWERTLQVRPDSRDALLSLARYYTQQGQKERAAEYLRRLETGD